MKHSLIVTAAPNGAYKQPAQHAALPITADTLAETARSCLDAGAAMLHMHVRRAVGRELVVQITTEAVSMGLGFENNLHLKQGSIAPDNAALVRQVAQGAQALGQRLATADEVRARFL